MNNYLFFRTDRIGDFLVSAILMKSIKKNNKHSHLTVIASQKNYFYIKTLDFIDEVHLYPSGLLKKIFFFYKLNQKKYTAIFALDGKKRSIFNVKSGIKENELLEIVKKDNNCKKYLINKNIKKIIFVQNRLMNILTNE